MTDYLDKRNSTLEFSNSAHIIYELDAVRKQWRLTLAENDLLKQSIKFLVEKNNELEFKLKLAGKDDHP